MILNLLLLRFTVFYVVADFYIVVDDVANVDADVAIAHVGGGGTLFFACTARVSCRCSCCCRCYSS